MPTDDKTVPMAPPSPPNRLGKYVLKREIARGGMGIVYEADDPELKRRVALKVVREGDVDPDFIARLHREAAIAAQLQHPNIVPVHEAGVEGTAHFIAMDYVEGRTLAQVLHAGAAGRDDLLRMIEDVSRAVAFAHSRGVVHRDLKPSNVLVDPAGRVLLTDFGIAKGEAFRTKLTQSQTVLGTPQYMAPEQVEGRLEAIDARTDVYALGVILYEALTGRAPFDAQIPAHLFRQILEDEPVRPTTIVPALPPELEVIALKAMSKERTQRYAAALDLADDLGRFRRGEPISAHAPSLLYGLRKRLARRRAVLTAVGATSLVALAVAGVLTYRLLTAQQRTLDQLQRRMEVALDGVLELRRAGARPEAMGKFAREAEAACREASAAYPALPEPRFHLGRLHRALMRDAEALAEQDAALARPPQHVPALYERIVLTARLHRRRVDDLIFRVWGDSGILLAARGLGPDRAGLAKGDAEATRLRARLAEDLRSLEARGAGALRPGEADCARGLRAWADGDAASARRLLDAAVQAAPALEEGYEALAALELDAAAHEASIAWCTRGHEADRGYVGHLEQRALARLLLTAQRRERGGPTAGLLAGAAEDLDQVLSRAPGRRDTRVLRGLVLLGSATIVDAPDEAARLRAAARAEFDRVKKEAPQEPRAWAWSAVTLTLDMLDAMNLRGEDPTAQSRAVLAELEQAMNLSPERDDLWMYHGLARGVVGLHRFRTGQDARKDADAAIADLDRALQMNAARPDTWMWRGLAHGCLWMIERDPAAQKEHWDQAEADFERAHTLDPDNTQVVVWRGAGWAARAGIEILRVQDPMRSWEVALADLDRALKLNPSNAHALRTRADTFEGRATWKQLWKLGDPAPDYRAALKDYEAALKVSPRLDPVVSDRMIRAQRYLRLHPEKR